MNVDINSSGIEENSLLKYSKNFFDAIFDTAIQRKQENKSLSRKVQISKPETALPVEDINKALSKDFLDIIFTTAIESNKSQNIVNQKPTYKEEKEVILATQNQPIMAMKKVSFDEIHDERAGDFGLIRAPSKEIIKLSSEKEFDSNHQFNFKPNEFKIEHKKTINDIVDVDMCIKEESQEHADSISDFNHTGLDLGKLIEKEVPNSNESLVNNGLDNEFNYNGADQIDAEERTVGLINLIKVDKDSTDIQIDHSRHNMFNKKEEDKNQRQIINNSSFGSSQSNLKGDIAHSFQPSKAEISYKAVQDYEDAIKSNIIKESKKNITSLLSTKKIDEVLIENDKSLSQIEKNNEDDHNVIDLETDPYGNSQKTEKKDDGVDFEVLNDVDFDKFNSKENMIDCPPQLNEAADNIVLKLEPSMINEEDEGQHENNKAIIDDNNYENYEFDDKEEVIQAPSNLAPISKPKSANHEAEIKEILQQQMEKLKVQIEEELKEKEKKLKENIRAELKNELIEEYKKANIKEGQEIKNGTYILKKNAKLKEKKSKIIILYDMHRYSIYRIS